jgi:hypothetical protein
MAGSSKRRRTCPAEHVTTCISPHVFEYGHLLVQACNDACSHALQICPTTQTTPAVDDACEGWPWRFCTRHLLWRSVQHHKQKVRRVVAWFGITRAYVLCCGLPCRRQQVRSALDTARSKLCCLTGSHMGLGERNSVWLQHIRTMYPTARTGFHGPSGELGQTR